MCGLFDQHGKGRSRGALDDLFGVTHDGSETKADFFGGRLWVETDQDRGYSAKSPEELFATVRCRLRDGFAVPEKRLKGPYVGNNAVYLNLSPQRYLAHRKGGEFFTRHLGIKPWVRAPGKEVTYWRKGDRILLFVLSPGRSQVELQFSKPVREVVDERSRKKLGDGDRFTIEVDDAAFLSLTR
jgi:hypothetical protein